MSDGVAIWLGIYGQWEGDPNPANDAQWVEQLATVAMLHGLPCYEDGVANADAAGSGVMVMWMVSVGSYGWINLQQVRTVERRESGAAVVHLMGGQEIALLAEEVEVLEAALRRISSAAASRYPTGVEMR